MCYISNIKNTQQIFCWIKKNKHKIQKNVICDPTWKKTLHMKFINKLNASFSHDWSHIDMILDRTSLL